MLNLLKVQVDYPILLQRQEELFHQLMLVYFILFFKYIILIKGPKLAVNLRVTTDSLVSRSHPLGTTAVPKLSERIDHGTKYSDISPYVENRQIHAQSTVVRKN